MHRRGGVFATSLGRGFDRITPRMGLPISRLVIVFSKAALLLCLLPSLLVASHVPAPGAARSTPLAVRSARAPAAKPALRLRQHAAATARAIERKLLLAAPRARSLRRFVSRDSGLVKRNVAAHCVRFRGHHPRHTFRRFFCRVWMQPRSPLSGVAVICYTKHHAFRVSKYHHRLRRTR